MVVVGVVTDKSVVMLLARSLQLDVVVEWW